MLKKQLLDSSRGRIVTLLRRGALTADDIASELTQLVDVFTAGLPADQLETMLRQAGKKLADELSQGRQPAGNLASRVAMASEMMNEQLGATTHVEGNGGYIIRGFGCPLAALTGKHHGVCLAMESLVAEFVGVPVRECCNRAERPQCCFEIRRRAQTERTNERR